MEKIAILTVVITRGDDQYGAWIEEIPGVYGSGDTVELTKKNLQEGIQLFVEENKELPALFKSSYEFKYVFDVPSFLEYYSKILSRSGLEKITSINQKQLGHYLNGVKKPTQSTVKKMDQALHKFAKELDDVHFI